MPIWYTIIMVTYCVWVIATLVKDFSKPIEGSMAVLGIHLIIQLCDISSILLACVMCVCAVLTAWNYYNKE